MSESKTSAVDELREIARKVGSEALSCVTNADEWPYPSVEILSMPDFHDRILRLADRIEAEYIELPVDADGVPIKPGDTVYSKIWSGERKVHRIESVGNCWTVSLSDAMFGCVNVFAHEVTHARPDSLERIAHDIETFYNHHAFISRDALYDFADRIRKLAKEDEQ